MTAATITAPAGEDKATDHPHHRHALRQLCQHGGAQPEAHARRRRGECLVRQRSAVIDYDPKRVTPDEMIAIVRIWAMRWRGAGGGRSAGRRHDVQQLRQHHHAHAQARRRRAGCQHELRQRAHARDLPALHGGDGRHRRAVRDAGYKVIEVEGAGEQAQVDAEQAARNAGSPTRSARSSSAPCSARSSILSMAEMVGIPPTFRGGCGWSPV